MFDFDAASLARAQFAFIVSFRAAVLILAYTAHACWVFRGKVTLESGYH